MSMAGTITITGRQACEWGPGTTDMVQSLCKEAMEAETGQTWEWRPLCNVDAIRLERVVDRPPTKRERLRRLAVQAYHAASAPLEAKMAGVLTDLFAPEMSQ